MTERNGVPPHMPLGLAKPGYRGVIQHLTATRHRDARHNAMSTAVAMTIWDRL